MPNTLFSTHVIIAANTVKDVDQNTKKQIHKKSTDHRRACVSMAKVLVVKWSFETLLYLSPSITNKKATTYTHQ